MKMYKELAILSGKGGTGKTTVSGAFATLTRNSVMADCDVDGADLHILLKPRVTQRREFYSGRQAAMKPEKCTGCGTCAEVCRFGAVSMVPASGNFATVAVIDQSLCEGCGVCVRACPSGAIDFPVRLCGEIFVSETPFGTMSHAKLVPGGENSGKLVTEVRKEAVTAAEAQGAELIIIDGPPGVGCQVIASVTGADAVLAVTEPTVSGAHDLERLAALARNFGIPFRVCVNRWDINPEKTLEIEKMVVSWGGEPIGRIPFDTAVVRAQMSGRSLIESGGPAAEAVRNVWTRVAALLRDGN